MLPSSMLLKYFCTMYRMYWNTKDIETTNDFNFKPNQCDKEA